MPRRPELTPRDVFDICYDRYVEARALLEGEKINAINPAASAKQAARHTLPRLVEYVTDFELAGRAVNSRGRRRVFDLYFCQAMNYRDAHRELRKEYKGKLPPATFDQWAYRVRESTGMELRRRGIFPPSRYFREPIKYQEEVRRYVEPEAATDRSNRPPADVLGD